MTADRLIQPPPRTTTSGTVLTGAAIILFSAVSFSIRPNPLVALLAFLFAFAAFLFRERTALSFLFFTALVAAAPLAHPPFRHWPFMLLLPILLHVVASLVIPRLRPAFGWLRAGRMGKDVLGLVVATAVVSGAALWLWQRLLSPDLAPHLRYMLEMPRWVFPLAGLGFAIGNAAMEEFVFRGLVMEATDRAFGPGLLSVVIQAWLFGALHFLEGFPNGWWGLVMTFIYGIMLGSIRRRSGGMLAPWLAHVFADVVIFAILAGIALKA